LQIIWVRCMTALVTDEPAVQVRDHWPELKT